jgi:hypothetical protein
MSKVVSIETVFGTLDADHLDTLRNGIKEMSVVLSKMDGLKAELKDVVDNIVDETKIPKKIVNRIGKVYHKNTYATVVVEDSEFQTLYSTVLEVAE